MSAAKHTPGPWKATSTVGEWVIRVIKGSDGKYIGGLMTGDAKCRANAHLIAAAPELLEALQLAYDTLQISYPLHSSDMDKRGVIFDQIRAALAKATGVTL